MSLLRVSKSEPCPICNHPDWCSVSDDDKIAICMRVADGSVRETQNGGFIHALSNQGRTSQRKPASKSSATVAPIERRDVVYTALLESLKLNGRDADDLLRRGLSDTEIARNLYASLPDTSQQILNTCRILAERHDLAGVPGFYRDYESRPMFVTWRSGYLIPVRDAQGKIQGCQIRQNGGSRYIWFSSPDHYEGTSSGSPVHFARPWRCVLIGEAIITEGALKADIIAEHLDAGVVAVAGVSSFRDGFGDWLRAQLPALQTVMLAFDCDWQVKPEVECAMLRLMASVEKAGLAGGLLDWSEAKGLDDLLTMEVAV